MARVRVEGEVADVEYFRERDQVRSPFGRVGDG